MPDIVTASPALDIVAIGHHAELSYRQVSCTVVDTYGLDLCTALRGVRPY